MFNLNYINAKSNLFDLMQNDYCFIANIDGFTTTASNISTSAVASMDGDFVNNVQAQPRTIIIDLEIKQGVNVEEAKREILRYIKPKQKGTLDLKHNDLHTTIEGVVESIEMPRFTDKVVMQVTLHCSQPFWEDALYIVKEISEIIDLHCFPYDNEDALLSGNGGLVFPMDEPIPFGEYDLNRTKAFTNSGDVSVGMVIKIIALGTVTNPAIYNEFGDFIGINYTLSAGDEITINTNKGKKSIVLVNNENPSGLNLLSTIKPNSTWLVLNTGDNEFTIDSDAGTESNMYFTLTYKQRYV